jgi:hypothetical protein
MSRPVRIASAGIEMLFQKLFLWASSSGGGIISFRIA